MTSTKRVNELEDFVFMDYLAQFLKEAVRRGVSLSHSGNEAFKARIAELEAANAKITNLHAVITKQAEKIKRQAARITELEALYAGTKRSKKAATIKAKYKALKRYVEARDD